MSLVACLPSAPSMKPMASPVTLSLRRRTVYASNCGHNSHTPTQASSTISSTITSIAAVIGHLVMHWEWGRWAGHAPRASLGQHGWTYSVLAPPLAAIVVPHHNIPTCAKIRPINAFAEVPRNRVVAHDATSHSDALPRVMQKLCYMPSLTGSLHSVRRVVHVLH